MVPFGAGGLGGTTCSVIGLVLSAISISVCVACVFSKGAGSGAWKGDSGNQRRYLLQDWNTGGPSQKKNQIPAQQLLRLVGKLFN